MKETNMEHFRGEIEAIMKDFEGFGVDINNSKLIACKSENCGSCKFSYLNNKNKEDPCTKHKIKWLMSEYKPEPVLTAMEKGFVEFAQEGWLARDISGVLHWFMRKPDRCEDEDYRCWNGPVHAVAFKKLNEIFPFITWKDEEPWSVEELRKLKALEYNPEDVAFPKGGEADEDSSM